MIVRLREWYGARTRREQWMLIAMLALTLPILAWLLVVRPLGNAYDAALEQHLEAVERHGRILSLAEAIRAEPSRPRLDQNVDLQLLVTESAGASGVTLTGVDPAGADGVSVAISNTSAPIATEWLRGLQARGLAVEELRMTPTGEGGVNVSALLARR